MSLRRYVFGVWMEGVNPVEDVVLDLRKQAAADKQSGSAYWHKSLSERADRVEAGEGPHYFRADDVVDLLREVLPVLEEHREMLEDPDQYVPIEMLAERVREAIGK